MVRRWPDFRPDTPGCGELAVEQLFPSGAGGGVAAAVVAAAASVAPSAAGAVAAQGAASAEAGSGEDAEEADVEHVDVVVVGGGLAGMAAAHSLARQFGAARVLLLEASGRLGGRIEATDPASFGGMAANVGANWIHFAEGNPILRLAERLGCPTVASANGNMEWHAKGLGQLSEVAIEEARSFAAELGKKLWSGRVPRGVSAARQLKEWAGERFEAPDAASHAARHVHFFTDSVQDNTAYLGDVSGSRLCDGVCGGDPQSADRHFTGEAGAGCLINGLAADMPVGKVEIRTGHSVKAIRALGPAAVPTAVELVVEAPAEAAGGTRPRLLTVRARVAVLTVPLGVLKASLAAGGATAEDEATCDVKEGSAAACADKEQPLFDEPGLIRFRSPLPPQRLLRWGRLGMGQSLRVALLFDRIFWNKHVEFFAFLMDDKMDAAGSPPADGSFFGEAPIVEFVNIANSTEKPTLLVEVGRHLAARLELLSDEEIGVFLVEHALRPMYPNEEVPLPVSVVAKRYGADPFLRGGLSYSAVEEEVAEATDTKGKEDLEVSNAAEGGYEERRSQKALELWSPLWGNRLVFAGEHTSLRIGTLDGAFISGLQAAWNAACLLAGDSGPALTPIELVRAVGVFGDWFPQTAETRKCLEKFAVSGYAAPGAGWAVRSARGRGAAAAAARSGRASGPCGASPRWLEELEIACRISAPEKPPGDPSTWRHCLDQGD